MVLKLAIDLNSNHDGANAEVLQPGRTSNKLSRLTIIGCSRTFNFKGMGKGIGEKLGFQGTSITAVLYRASGS